MATSDLPATSSTAPEVAALRQALDGRHAATRDMVRAHITVPRPDLPQVEHRVLVLERARQLAAAGQTTLGFPVAYGGRGDVGASVAAFETLAFGDLSLLVKCGVQFGLFGGAILQLGTARHHEAYLRDIASLALPGCFAMTETDHGSNVQALRTTATYDAETAEFVLRTPDDGARKDYIGNAARDGRMAVVFAQLHVGGEHHGVHALVVGLRDAAGAERPGVRTEDCGAKLGLNGVDNGRIWFDDVRVPREALLDRYASVGPDGTYTSPIANPSKRFFTMLSTLVQGRVSVGGAAIAATKVGLTLAVRHGLRRRQFGPPGGDEVVLMDYLTHQRRLLPAVAKTYALTFAQGELVDRLHHVFTGDEDRERERRELETLAAGLKAVATQHATETIQECREACGGMGYLQGNRFGALKADTDVFTTFEGDNTVLLQLTANNLLTDFRHQLGELDPLGMAGFYAGQLLGTVAERTALREVLGRLADDLLPGRDDEGDLLGRTTQIELLRWRAEHVRSGVARRIKGGLEAGSDPFAVTLRVQDHIVETARAYVDVVVLEAFAAAVGEIEDPAARRLADRVCDLYALSTIEAERGWFQEHGRLSSTRSKAVIRAVNALCAQLRPHAGTLVEAFGVPPAALGDAEPVARAAP